MTHGTARRDAESPATGTRSPVNFVPALLWIVVFAGLAAEGYHAGIWWAVLGVVWFVTCVLLNATARRGGIVWITVALMWLYLDAWVGWLPPPGAFAIGGIVLIVLWHAVSRGGRVGGVGAVARALQIAMAAVLLGVLGLTDSRGLRGDVDFLIGMGWRAQAHSPTSPEELAIVPPGRVVSIEGRGHCAPKPMDTTVLFDCSELMWTRTLPQMHDPLREWEASSYGFPSRLWLFSGLESRAAATHHGGAYLWREVGNLSVFIPSVNQGCATLPPEWEEAQRRCDRMKDEIASNLWLTVFHNYRDTLSWTEWSSAAEAGQLGQYPAAYVMDSGSAVDRAFQKMSNWLAEQRQRRMLASYQSATDGVRLVLLAGEGERWPTSFRTMRMSAEVQEPERASGALFENAPAEVVHRLKMQAQGEPFRVSGLLRAHGLGPDGVPKLEIDVSRTLAGLRPLRARVALLLLAVLVIAWQGGELIAMALLRQRKTD